MSYSMPDDTPTISPEPVDSEQAAREAGAPGDNPGAPGDNPGAPAPAEVIEGTSEPLEEETVDAVPVLAEARPIESLTPAALPAVQAVAVAATGFVAGAATIALVKRHSARKVARASRSAPRRAVDLLPIVGSRTFLVDVHLIAKPQE